ncbi:unnamed protein product [Rotaria socialis]|uniref:Coilin tudor domain-containing protein n=2 Tax=Rotaria socialis TaxID=392032 RepID=A0A818PSB9_9BILA|nr:unnamed protein product [Rotaria socialis]CAF4466228.1 unnamed protein product [Rotaria socialis]
MSAVRVQIRLKYMFDDNSTKEFHNFWYAFEPSKLLTIGDIIEDIRSNYIENQISLCIEGKDDEQIFLIHLNDCQLLPFTSSQIIRDNDQLTFMPLKNFRLQHKSFQDSVNLNLSCSIAIQTPPPPPQSTLSENSHEHQRIESVKNYVPLQSTISKSIENIDEQSSKKKIKTKSNENQVMIPPIIRSVTRPPSEVQSISPIIQPTPAVSQQTPSVVKSTPLISETTTPVLKEHIVEEETTSEQPLSLSSTNVRIRNLKSKTPAWKSQTPPSQGSVKDKLHVRFDSDSDEEPISQIQITDEEKTSITILPLVNDSNSSVRIHYVPTITKTTDVAKISDEAKNSKKTVDLLFEMKQHKTPEERQAKKIKQQFSKKRSQHKKRALDYFSMANFVDQAFGIDKNELEKQISPNGYHASSSNTPQTLPTSFNKLARLPLVAEAIENNDKIYDLYPPVEQCPAIQTRIAFKLLELGEDFCPKMSTFKEGTVMNVDQTTGELTIQLDKPFQTVFDQPSKFYAPSEEQLSTEDLTNIVLPFSDLNSVRLLPTTNDHSTA